MRIPRLSKEVSIYDPDKGIGDGIGDAATKATNYISADSSGIKVHNAGDSSNYAHITSDGMDVYQGGTSVASFGDTARVGKAAGPRTVIQASGVDLYGASDGSVNLAHFGYASGNAESGTSVQPYYTFGTRESGSAIGNLSVSEGYQTTASGSRSHAEGHRTTASGSHSHAEGGQTTASGANSHAEGEGTTASAAYSHAEGEWTTASGYGDHAEGGQTTASGGFSHAEGYNTTASESSSHAEGHQTTASGSRSHAEGYNTTASAANSHAEGINTTASAANSHAEGYQTTASGTDSHAQNFRTIAASSYQTAMGKYNVEDTADTYALIIGNGSSSARSDALTVKWNGEVQALNAHNAITAAISAALTLATAEANIALSSNVNVGSGFSIVSGGVKCAVAGTVSVTALVYFSGVTDQDQCHFSIKKGSTNVSHATVQSSGNANSVALPEKLVTVAAGDVLYLSAGNGNAARGTVPAYASMTYMTVRYV